MTATISTMTTMSSDDYDDICSDSESSFIQSSPSISRILSTPTLADRIDRRFSPSFTPSPDRTVIQRTYIVIGILSSSFYLLHSFFLSTLLFRVQTHSSHSYNFIRISDDDEEGEIKEEFEPTRRRLEFNISPNNHINSITFIINNQKYELDKKLIEVQTKIDHYKNIVDTINHLYNYLDNLHHIVNNNSLSNNIINNIIEDNRFRLSLLSDESNTISEIIFDYIMEVELLRDKIDLCNQLSTVDFDNCSLITEFESSNCRICFDNTIYGFKLSCNHTFHIECLLLSYLENKKCPLCRTPIQF